MEWLRFVFLDSNAQQLQCAFEMYLLPVASQPAIPNSRITERSKENTENS